MAEYRLLKQLCNKRLVMFYGAQCSAIIHLLKYFLPTFIAGLHYLFIEIGFIWKFIDFQTKSVPQFDWSVWVVCLFISSVCFQFVCLLSVNRCICDFVLFTSPSYCLEILSIFFWYTLVLIVPCAINSLSICVFCYHLLSSLIRSYVPLSTCIGLYQYNSLSVFLPHY